MKNQARVLAVFAHPDDETYGPGGTLAKLAAEGARVRLITLTRGESATMGDSPRYSPELLADTRERELQCAVRALGISEHRNFVFPDKALENVPAEELASPIKEALEDFRPHLVITFHPEGISGHNDHRAVSRLLADLLRSDPEDEARGSEAPILRSDPEDGARERVAPIPRSASDDRVRKPKAPSPRLAYYCVPHSVGAKIQWRRLFTVADEAITHVLDVGGYFEAKLAAAECHKTQRYMLERLSGIPGGIREMWRYEYFIVEGESRRGAPRTDLLRSG